MSEDEIRQLTEKRIEMLKLLQQLRRDDEPPGDTILRALRAALSHNGTRKER